MPIDSERKEVSPAARLALTKKPRKSNPLPTDPVIRCDIRKFRNEHRLSLRDVANATGLAIANIHRVERGGDIQLTTARILSRFFGRDIDELWPQD